MQGLRKVALAGLVALAIPAWGADLAVLSNGFSIRFERQEQMGAVTRLYMAPPASGYVDVPTASIDHIDPDLAPKPPAASPEPKTPASAAAPSPASHAPQVQLGEVVANAGQQHQLDPDLIQSVIHAESDFNAHAVSPKGAQGLMQLMPHTASLLGVNNPFDPAANVDGGARYLRMLLERYNFDLAKALAAYNAGPERVEQYRGVPPYYETQLYVAKIIRDFNRKKLAEQKAAAAKAKAAKASTDKTRPAPSVAASHAATPSR